ncbi:Phenolphthiocerol/phthiocerol polyketide synthase subunit E [Mycobacterium sp. smrl_JER01]|uniref:type I polyketide synthase n=1 Tax=Mycobacterium sp. smrl_JER01 TaxID=3402633 RepID=UPI003D72C9CF
MTSGALNNTDENNTDELPDNAIAVIGMAGKFPGAGSVSEFWRNLRAGVESIVDLSEDELLAHGVTEKALSNRGYVRRAGLMPGIEEFDADFFGFTPYAARMLDPQHRLFLQTVFHALEDAGYDPKGLESTVGVFGTSSSSGYLLHNLMSNFDPMMVIGQGASFEMVNLSLQNDKDHLATRVAHQFDFRGPALSVATACSSSLVAVHLACQSILNGECDIALAGGSSLRIPHHVGYWYEQGAMVSPTGQCRPFDVRSDGTIFASGVGVVVLKALADAVDDGDHIHAVIRGSALNNDGATKMTYAAPNALGQAEVIAEAHAIAGVDASTITYVETHGTGTPLGDPIEIEGLRQAFELAEETRSAPCYLGSVKSNIGHLETAAGIAGLIKAILCLEHKAIPATLHYTSPNPELHIDRGPFRIRSADGPWESDGVRRAGVSSFGVGGTNAHIVLEEAPAVRPISAATPVRSGPAVLVLSARTEEALAQSRAALAAHLSASDEAGDEINLPDAAYTLTRRRKEPFRLAAVVRDQPNAATVLSTTETDNVFVGRGHPDWDDSAVSTDRVAFLFPGQGAQHVGMARGLYDSEPVFARHFDQAATAFGDEMGYDLKAEIFDGVGRNLEHTDRAQPALFAVEYALAKLVQSYGVQPAVMAGHSIGEYPAATLAGVFDLDTAVKVVSMRAKLMHAAPRGVMVAVPLSPEAVAQHLTPDVDIATVNDPGSCVIAGSDAAIRAFQAGLAEKGIAARRVRTSHAFHSRLMDQVVAEFTTFLSGMTLREPQIPLLSNITGTTMSAAEATNPATWARQIRATVRFADELDMLLAMQDRVLVEVGPGGTLTSSAGRHPRWSDRHRAVRLMRHQAQNRSDHDTFLLALGQLWAADVEVDWDQGAEQDHTLVTLPGYPFARQRHWVEHNANAAWLAAGAGGAGGPVAAGGSATAAAAAGGTSTVETALQSIWARCLGVSEIDRNANFFEIGGDSLIAISVAMTAGHEGLDLTPQDLYENQTVAALAKVLTARYAEGGLARQTMDDAVNPPVPPNVAYFLEHGLRDIGRWRIPVILGLRADVAEADVRAVLTAVTETHDALRVHLVERAGTWDQRIAEPGEFTELAVRELPDGLAAGSPQERTAVLEFLDEQVREHQMIVPLTATFIRGVTGGPSYLALSLHGIAGDDVSRDVLLTDLFTAFNQRMAGEEIVLAPVPASWREWSQRCAALASHPAVLDSRDYWLETANRATLSIAGPEPGERPGAEDVARLSTALSGTETGEIDDARRRLRLPVEEILLAALGRAVAATTGDGAVTVDLGGRGRSVLKPDVDLQRTVGWFTTIHPVVLNASAQSTARELLDDVRATVKAVPHYGIGYGLLRYLYAPTARVLGANRPADILFSHIGTIPDAPADQPEDAPVRFDADTAMPIRDALPGLGHALELRVYRAAGVLHLDWWYDQRRLGPTDVESFARQYSTALLDVTREALADEDVDAAGDELALVDLS